MPDSFEEHLRGHRAKIPQGLDERILGDPLIISVGRSTLKGKVFSVLPMLATAAALLFALGLVFANKGTDNSGGKSKSPLFQEKDYKLSSFVYTGCRDGKASLKSLDDPKQLPKDVAVGDLMNGHKVLKVSQTCVILEHEKTRERFILVRDYLN